VPYGNCPQVLSKSGNSYEPRCLTNFHILRDWGRKGFSKDGTERICCFPGAEPQQDKLLTGDNRCAAAGMGRCAALKLLASSLFDSAPRCCCCCCCLPLQLAAA